MLPRRTNIAPTSIYNKPKLMQPTSLLPFGMRINAKQQLSSKTSNKDATTSSKIIKQTAINLDKKHNTSQQMQFHKGLHDFLDNQCPDMQNQNQECKQQSLKDRLLFSQNMTNRKIFSDQISQKPNLLKLNNITNMYQNQKQSLKDNPFKNQLSSLLSCQFLQDTLFENDIENKTQKIYVDMKKKIKKISKSKRLLHKTQKIQDTNLGLIQNQEQKKRREMAEHHRQLMNHAFLDQEVIIDSSLFCNQIINHRIDNDIDTDDEQIASGIKKLKKALEEAAQFNKKWIAEQNSFMEEIQSNQDNSMQDYFCGPNQAYFC